MEVLAARCLPAFLVPVEVRPTPQYGDGQCGVFATAPIKAGTRVWEWSDLVRKIHYSELPAVLESMDPGDAAIFLRQGFVTPADLEHLNVNPQDAGRFTNHSLQPTVGVVGALRDIMVGEELTMDYGWHGDPAWYQKVCARYGVDTESQVAKRCRTKNTPTTCGKKFEFVGPLFAEKQATVAETLSGEETANLFQLVEDASAASRKIVYVSLGTVVTGEHPEMGWNGKSKSGITGKELCQSVYRAVFAELGSSNTGANILLSPPPLLVLSVGPPPDALEHISVPENAICLKSVPQVELLRLAKPALFVTNGGQNSFMESLSVGTPLVICPGFGDQVANAAKAQRLGLGEKVDRPGESQQGNVIMSYQAAVATAIQKVLGESQRSYLARAQEAAAELEHAGGVSTAVEILVRVASAGQK